MQVTDTSSTSKKILILTPFYPPNTGGAETFCHDLVETISEHHHIDVLTFQPFEGKAIEHPRVFCGEGSIQITRMNWGIHHKTAWEGVSIRNFFSVFPRMFFRTKSLICANRYDIVHAQGLLAGLVAVLVHKRVFLTLLALYDFPSYKWYVRKLTKFILKRCECVFVEGENGLKNIDSVIDNTNKVKIFNHWTDQQVFSPPLNRENDITNVLFIGRPIKIKGMHIIKEAEKLLNNPKFRFEYVTKVKFQDLPKYYKKAHICVIPSIYDEGYSRVVMEASSCGCAIIASNRGSLPEQVSNFGVVIEPTPEKFAFALNNIRRTHYQIKSYEYAKKFFSNQNAEVFLAEYKR